MLLGVGADGRLSRRSRGGFFGDAATYYSLGHSLAEDFDFEYRREDLVRVWREFPERARGHLPEARPRRAGPALDGVAAVRRSIVGADDPDASRLYYGKAFIYPLFAAPFVWLFGTNGFLVLHALLMTLCFACAYAFLVARSQPIPALLFAARVPVRLGRAGLHGVADAGLLQPGDRALRLLLLVLQGSGRRVDDGVPRAGGGARWLMAPRSDVDRGGLARHRDVLEAHARPADRAAAGAVRVAPAVARAV